MFWSYLLLLLVIIILWMCTLGERYFHLRGKKCSKNDAKRLSMGVATSGLWATGLVTLWIGSRVYYSTFLVFLDKILFYNAGEYIRAFRQTPLDPLVSLCLGLQYLHLASQRFPRHRHTCVIQVKIKMSDNDDDDDCDNDDDDDDDGRWWWR